MDAFIVIAIASGLVILLALEFRHRGLVEELDKVRADLKKTGEEIIALKKDLSLKKNIYEEHGPSKNLL